MRKAAVHNPSQREVTDDLHAFFQRTGLIVNYKEIEWLGFKLDNFTGLFWRRHLPELMEFCSRNEEYHIISLMPGVCYENCYNQKAKNFHLAKGDSNPHLVLNPFLHKQRDLLYEEIFEEVLAKYRDVDGNDKR